MATAPRQPSPLWNPQFPLWLASLVNLCAALLQLLLFVPKVSEGQTSDVALWPCATLPLAFRIDSLSLTFGVAWTLALALLTATMAVLKPEWSHARRNSGRVAWSVCLMSLGLLAVAYSRDLLLLYLGWEVAGLALWLALRPMWHGRKGWLIVALHSPGWLLLALLALGLAAPLAPPAGGAAPPWPLPAALALGVVALARSGSWPLHRWSQLAAEASGGAGAMLLSLYCISAPYLLAKALVAAPWDALGIWALSLLGTLALLGSVIANLGVRGAARIPAIASAHAAAATIGFAMAPSSPLAAMGAVALLLSCSLSVTALAPANKKDTPWLRTLSGWSALQGGSVGVWAIAQGALTLHYGLITAILLPAGALLMLADERQSVTTPTPHASRITHHASPLTRLLPAALLAFTGCYPQGVVEWILRPVVSAMAGGVGALLYISSEWGLGLLVRSGEETMLATLPATGIALAVALALIALYWLTRLVRRFAHLEVLPDASINSPSRIDVSGNE